MPTGRCSPDVGCSFGGYEYEYVVAAAVVTATSAVCVGFVNR